MLKKALTLATAIVAVGGAFVGNANAKNLVINQGWYLSDGDVLVGPDAPTAICPDESNTTCAYFMNENGAVDEGSKINYPLS